MSGENPYPGLPPFEPDQNHLFFGRDEQVEELLVRLGASRFLAVVGRSGSGKSSLVRAGLLPALYGGFMTGAGSGWRISVFRPGDAPVANLADALSDPELYDANKKLDDSWRARAMLDVTLRRSQLGLQQAVRERGLADGANLLLVVDQFEELFRFRRLRVGTEAGEEASAFVKLLLEAAKQTELPIYVVLTMRSDFLGDCAEFVDLPEAINDGQFLIPRLNRDQHRQAIEGPAAVAGGSVAPRLVNRLLNEVDATRDQLPILQHALMRTWDSWDRRTGRQGPLDLDDYNDSGGMDVALSDHVDELYAELDEEQERIADGLFRTLTELGSGSRGIRRPTKLSVIADVVAAPLEDVIDVVDGFRAPGCSFLMPPAGTKLEPDSVLDISHESLMRVSIRLQRLVENEAESATILRRLVESAAMFDSSEAGPVKDPELSRSLAWMETKRPTTAWVGLYRGDSAETELAGVENFLAKSVEAREHERGVEKRQQQLQEEAETAKREAKRIRRLFSVAAVITLSFVALGAFAYVQWQQADFERERATEAQEEAMRLRESAIAAKQVAEQASYAAEEARADAIARSDELEEALRVSENRRQLAEAAVARAETAARESYQSVEQAQETAQALVTDLRDAQAQGDEAKVDAILSDVKTGGVEADDLGFEIPDPVTIVYLGRRATLSGVTLNGRGNAVRVTPHEQVRIAFDWSVETESGMYCPTCFVQIYFGVEQPGGASPATTCISDSINAGSRNAARNVFTAPERSGIYFVRLGGSLQYGCTNEAADYEKPDNVFAVVVVEPARR